LSDKASGAKTFLRSACLIGGLTFILAGNPALAEPVGILRILNSNAGTIMTANAAQHGDDVYIEGLANRPSGPDIGAHVDVWGENADKRIIFFKTTSVVFTGKPSFIRTSSFVVSVKPDLFDKATRVYVAFYRSAFDHSASQN
jgi:hypothetical protein